MIGLFDSGVGGLAVLREVRGLMPQADLLYIADQANAPYGEKPLAAVRDRAEHLTRWLVEQGAGTVVIACNTASAVALHHVRDLHPRLTIVGMEPAVKPAAAGTNSGVVGIMATPATFQTDVVASLVERFAAGVEVLTRGCPGLAQEIEDGTVDLGTVLPHVRPLVAAGADTIVIGCTHYSFVTQMIRDSAGPDVGIVDPAAAVARQVARVSKASGSGTTRFATTANPTAFAGQINRLLGIDAESVHTATVGP
jgi:glutamate racemase